MGSRAEWASQAEVMSGQESQMVGGEQRGDLFLHRLTRPLALQKPFYCSELEFSCP